MGTKRVKVAVIGGGVASLTAAFELTQPHLRGKYDVTVYQLGWRLGGKGASGRGVANRIEEHGLHLWMGFYDNAFALMRAVYDELGRDPSQCHIASWRDAFKPAPRVGLADLSPDGQWLPWMACFPALPGEPGDPLPGPAATVQTYLARGAALLRELLVSAYRQQGESGDESGDKSGDANPARLSRSARPARSARSLGEQIGQQVGQQVDRLLSLGSLATAAAVIEAAELLKTLLGSARMDATAAILRLLDALGDMARASLEKILVKDDGTRRIWEVIDLVLAILRGAVRFGLAFDPRGFDAIDDYDWREWLWLNGASRASLDSAFMRGIYNFTFAYRDGDERRPALSAGCALRGSLRMFFGYRGALFWHMAAGMGDIVFAPLYQVLRRRGVRFEFFHRLENVELSRVASPDQRPHVAALEFDVQAEISAGEYHPLVDVRGLPCWPSEPDWSQLASGDELRREGRRFESFWDDRKVGQKTLRVGRDFDIAVVGLGIGAVAHTCRELVATDRRWQAMVERVEAVATQSFQLWLRPDMKQLGWPHGPINLAGFVPPFETWADMRHLLPEESWPDAPRSLAYFCSVLPTPSAVPDRQRRDYPRQRHEEVERNIVEFLQRELPKLWPNAIDRNGEFRWDELVDASEPCGVSTADGPAHGRAEGSARLASQFVIANVDPTAYYTLAAPGTSRYRISPLDRTFDNLTIAGDWTECGLNTGCIEAAIISGRLAAHAISLSPPLRSITGYDHP